MKRLFLFMLVVIIAATPALSGCSFVREGITGERQNKKDTEGGAATELPVLPPAFNIIGDWFGVYSGSEYVAFRFTADGKCELQPAVYPSDMFGPRYYGEYKWGGEDGKEILLDMYKGVSREVNYGNDNIWDEWSDGGRETATTALNVSFYVYGGSMKSVALKTSTAGVDTDGYTVIQTGAFLTLLSEAASGVSNLSPFLFGSEPYDTSEGKSSVSTAPDTFTDRAERFYTTAELNVRCGPGTDFKSYGTVPVGTPVDKIGYMGTGHEDWVFVLLQDGGGWVNTGYLADSPPAPETDDVE